MPFAPQELRKFHDAGRAIAQAANVGLEDWARGAAGVVLRDWTSNVPLVNPKRIDDRARGRVNLELGISRKQNQSFSGNPYQITVNTGGRKGRPEIVWTRNEKTKKWQIAGTASGGAFVPANRHWTDAMWAKISAGASKFAGLAPEFITRGHSAAGLARQSVIQIADALGIALETVKGGRLGAEGIAQARSAVASNGKTYQNGTGTYRKTDTSFEIEMVDRYSRNKEAKVAEALELAVATQVVQFKTNMINGVFASVAKTVKAYPYLSVT